MAAIKALETRSLEFMQEKEEKKKLEQRIAALTNQMIRGERERGAGGITSPDVQVIVKQHQEKLRQEYENKLADLERERETIEEERAQVDRYKQLLLKQRDIMIALTQRLVERDEQIMKLQDELDLNDDLHCNLQEALDEKTALLIRLQRIAMEVNARIPYGDIELTKALESCREIQRVEIGPSNATEIVDVAGSDADDASITTTAATIDSIGNNYNVSNFISYLIKVCFTANIMIIF